MLKVLLGLVFIVSAVLKLFDMDQFEIYVYSYHFFSLNFSFIVARLAIILELVLGIGLISKYAGLFLKTYFHDAQNPDKRQIYTVKGTTTMECRKMWGLQED